MMPIKLLPPAALAHQGGDPVVAVKTCPVVPSARSDGTPVAEVISTPLFAVANADITFAEEAYSNVFIAFVFGYVVVVALQFVPSALSIVPVEVAVEG
jgi:hypothetical protein